MTAPTRKKWFNRMFQLLNQADCANREDQLIIIAEITGITPRNHRDDLTDQELRQVVNQLNDWNKQGELGQQITNILSNWALGDTEDEQDDDETEP